MPGAPFGLQAGAGAVWTLLPAAGDEAELRATLRRLNGDDFAPERAQPLAANGVNAAKPAVIGVQLLERDCPDALAAPVSRRLEDEARLFHCGHRLLPGVDATARPENQSVGASRGLLSLRPGKSLGHHEADALELEADRPHRLPQKLPVVRVQRVRLVGVLAFQDELRVLE